MTLSFLAVNKSLSLMTIIIHRNLNENVSIIEEKIFSDDIQQCDNLMIINNWHEILKLDISWIFCYIFQLPYLKFFFLNFSCIQIEHIRYDNETSQTLPFKKARMQYGPNITMKCWWTSNTFTGKRQQYYGTWYNVINIWASV